MRPQRRQPTRLPHPWDSPGRNTEVGCHFLLQCMKVKSEVKSLSRVRLFTTSRTAAYQAPPSMGFSRQEYWSGVPWPSPGMFPRIPQRGSEFWLLSLRTMFPSPSSPLRPELMHMTLQPQRELRATSEINADQLKGSQPSRDVASCLCHRTSAGWTRTG